MRYAVLLLALTGCHLLFQLDELPPVRACSDPQPGADSDGDGVVDERDACPFFPREALNDEDGDGVLDDCDPCPNLEGTLAGDDAECDGIGAACDPDEALAHDRTFWGFAELGGIELYRATLANGGVSMSIDATNKSAFLLSPMLSLTGVYETQLRIRNGAEPAYWFVAFTFSDGATEYDFGVSKTSTPDDMSVVIREGGVTTALARVPLASATADMTMRFRVDINPTGAAIEVSYGTASSTTSAAFTLQDSVKFGVLAYRDTWASTMDVDVEYLSRIVVR